MAAWGYKFYLLMLKVSLTSERNKRSEILSALEDKIRIPARPCNFLYILFIHHVTIFFSFLACSPLFFT